MEKLVVALTFPTEEQAAAVLARLVGNRDLTSTYRRLSRDAPESRISYHPHYRKYYLDHTPVWISGFSDDGCDPRSVLFYGEFKPV